MDDSMRIVLCGCASCPVRDARTPMPLQVVARAKDLDRRCPNKKPRQSERVKLVLPRPLRGKAANVRCKKCPDGSIKFHNRTVIN